MSEGWVGEREHGRRNGWSEWKGEMGGGAGMYEKPCVINMFALPTVDVVYP